MVVFIVALMFIVFIAISYVAGKRSQQTAVDAAPIAEEAVLQAPATYFHPGHTFAKIAGDGSVTVGMDEFAKQAFGVVNNIELPAVGRILKQGETAWKATVGERQITQPMPLTGTIEEVNENAKDASWILKVKPLSLQQNLANLIKETFAASWMSATRQRFQAGFASSLVPVMQDGGELVEGFAGHLEEEQWEEFCAEFFSSECKK